MIFRQLKALVKRDLRLLSRSKSSSTAILLGPLLVILVVGVVFSGVGNTEPTLGVISGEFENSQLYEQSLDDSFTIASYQQKDLCILDIQQGLIVGCVVFDSSQSSAEIHVDPTDTSVVYMIIDRITGALEESSGELRSGLTSTLLSAVSNSSSSLAADEQRLADILDSFSQSSRSASEISQSLGSVNVDANVVDVGDVRDVVDEVIASQNAFRTLADSAISDVEDNNRSDELRDEYQNISVVEEGAFNELFSSLEQASSQLSSASQRTNEVSSSVRDLESSLSSRTSELEEVVASIRSSRMLLGGLDISADEITSPLETQIVEVTSSDDSFGSLLPQFLTLLVMFTALLLASQLVVRERASRAYFRNFTTPTRDWAFVLSTYVSTVIVLLVQLVLLFVVVSVFSSIGVFENFLVNILVLFLVVSFFAFLGMLIGYVFKSQEGVMLSAITISSALMLVSGLVLPVQTLPAIVQFFVAANPFVISSDLLTGSLVFGFGLSELFSFISVLGLYAVMLFAAIMITQRAARVSYFESSKTAFHISTFLGESEVPEGKELRVGEQVVSSKEQLLAVLKQLSNEEYEEFADHRRNLFADWIRDVYKDDRLSRLLRNKSRSGAIEVLQKELR